MEKTFMTNSMILLLIDTKKSEKLTTWQGEDYTTGRLLDYNYIKNHCRLITVDLSREK